MATDITVPRDPGDLHAIGGFNATQQPTTRTGIQPEDLIIYMAGYLDWSNVLSTARVCRLWRYAIINCTHLWAHLDLYNFDRHALLILPRFLHLSGNAPLTIRIWLSNDDEHSDDIGTLCSQLQPLLHRLRALTVRSRRPSNYAPLFSLLQGSAPMLMTLDVSHDPRKSVVYDSAPWPPNDILALAPNLSFVNWESHILPRARSRLFDMTHLRIDAHSIPIDQIFFLFPCVRTLHLDMFEIYDSDSVQRLPPDHPLETLTIGGRCTAEFPNFRFWAYMMYRGFGRVAMLGLCHCASSVVVYVGKDATWELTSVKVDYDDFVDASFIQLNSDSQCRMTNLRPYRSRKFGIIRVMRETDWLRALVSFTLSMALSVNQKRPSLLLPRGRLPALREFSLICGNDGLKGDENVELWGSLLDADIMATCGLLEAPQLRVMHLLSRTPRHFGDGSIISPAALARFISSHVQVGGGRVPLLKISIFLQFKDDPAGLAALRAAVDLLEHWV